MKTLIGLGLVLAMTGCAATCPIINVATDIAKDACPVVVEYLSEDGEKHSVVLDREEIKAAAAQQAAKQGAPAPAE